MQKDLEKLSQIVEKCRCFAAQQFKKDTSFDNELGLDDYYEEPAKTNLSNSIDETKNKKEVNEMLISTNIKPQMKSVKINSRISDLKKMMKLKSLSKIITNSKGNSERQSTEDNKDRELELVVKNSFKEKEEKNKNQQPKATAFMNIVKYQTVDSENTAGLNFDGNDCKFNQDIENYNSYKTEGTILDEFEINYNQQDNKEFELDMQKFGHKGKTRSNYRTNSVYSRSPSNSIMEDDKVHYNSPFAENSCFGTNISKYYQKIASHNLKDYAHETENTEKDILLETENSPINRNMRFNKKFSDNMEINLDRIQENEHQTEQGKTIDMEYSYSYAQTNELYQSNLNNDDAGKYNKIKKPSMLSNVSIISEDDNKKSLCDITLGSINNHLSKNIDNNNVSYEYKSNVGDNFQSQNQYYSDEDYNPK